MVPWDIFLPLVTTLPHIGYIPIITLIVFTFLNKEKSDTKWFFFHTAILNLTFCIFIEFYDRFNMMLDYFIFQNFYDRITQYSRNLSIISIFPLALARFASLYFEKQYEKLVTKKTIAIWILGYDMMFIALYESFVRSQDNYLKIHPEVSHYFLPITYLIIIFGTLIFAFLIVYRIFRMMKLVGKHSPVSTLRSLRMAAFICIFQACCISVLVFISWYLELYALFKVIYFEIYRKDPDIEIYLEVENWTFF